MSRDVVTIAPTATVKQAANVMRGRLIGSLVVTENARPVGMLTVSDLLELVGRGGARVAPATPRPLLHHRAPHKKRHVSVGSW
jgi:CBS domain-containing protein